MTLFASLSGRARNECGGMNAHCSIEPVADGAEMDPQACRNLWCAVLAAMWDLATRPCRRDSRSEIEGAREWFGSRDFHMVCALAGFDGMAVLERYRGGVTLRVIRNESAAGRAVRRVAA